jgi:small subunit ribosomal protein S17
MADEERNEQEPDQEQPEAAEATEQPQEAPAEEAEQPQEAPAEEAADAPADEPQPDEAAAEEAAPEESAAEEEGGEDAPAEEPTPKQRRKLERSQASGPALPPRSPEERAGERAERRRSAAASRRRNRAHRREKRGEPKAGTPPAESESAGRKVRQGTVVSAKAAKTISVRLEITRRHRTYEKVVRKSSTVHAHDERDEAGEGDVVRVVETRPLSRSKRWRLLEVVEKAR